MNRSSSSPISDNRDEYPKVTQANLDRATFRVGLGPAPRKQRITISLDAHLVEYFKSKSGGRGYQTLINETLRRATEREELEDALRRVIREELRHEPRHGGT
ncbi:MAG: BrnA antitoxin family protein [Gammaproteobacteria bacterium]|nr:BrnA antitoxin family protein [Gammaproteobacteria bacterium]